MSYHRARDLRLAGSSGGPSDDFPMGTLKLSAFAENIEEPLLDLRRSHYRHFQCNQVSVLIQEARAPRTST